MSRLLRALDEHARSRPTAPAVIGDGETLDYRTLQARVERLAEALRHRQVRCVALLADNGPRWIVVDLACLRAGIPLIPVPHFFSPAQIAHMLKASGCGELLAEHPAHAESMLRAGQIAHAPPEWFEEADLHAFALRGMGDAHLPRACAKVTFTSGSTGEPKGVCLALAAMEQVAASLAQVSGATAEDRHLCLLPFATLLENIGGIYAPLLIGATMVAPGLETVGWRGASGLEIPRFARTIAGSGAASCIMIPQMLLALVSAVAQGMSRPAKMRYIAVGGAPVAPKLLAQAAALGLPAYEGYGLSEAASVVAVNTPEANRPGSVGKPLPHVELAFAEDGEILVRGSLFMGYLGQPAELRQGYWPTGDIGHLDADGFLHLEGRKKHIFITAFGRNVSPEWVERELQVEPAIAQACVFGEARPFNVAVVVPRPGHDRAAVDAALASANARLPDYARIGRVVLARAPFTVENGQWTGTGRPRRAAILAAYRNEIEAQYKE
ncbi:MAG: long-chain acyl-CoA synthetase [Zetaproteobacteria bacterium]|nr:MAG: long-chain acyl-CoA synthetase [Zetaproteobacteria bacterium]